MCRILIMDDSELRTLSDKARMYLNLLGMDAQLDITTTTEDACYHLRAAQRYDLLITCIPSSTVHSQMAESAFQWQPSIRRLFIAELNDYYPLLRDIDYVLAAPMSISGFYDVFSSIFQEHMPSSASIERSKRWYASHDALLDRILSVLQIIRKEYMNDISLNYLATKVYSSPCYLSTLFSKVMGVSPMAYVNDLRMDRAVELLCTTEMSVTDICQRVGYRNLPYFCTCFKNRYGMTPAQYRRQEESRSAS